MLQVSGVEKYFGDARILGGASFTLGVGDRAGIVGPNGCGKTTLLRIIAGQERPDAGAVSLAPGARLAYMRQGYHGADTSSVSGVLEPAGAVWSAHLDLDRAITAQAERPSAAVAKRYAACAERFEDAGGYPRLAVVEQVLRGLDLAGLDPGRTLSTLSGGQKTRLALAALLLDEPDLLLLDEPTNHLDVDALTWLEGFIARFRRAVLLVSHDRAFLDATVSRVLELSERSGTIAAYPGGYTAYAAAKKAELEAQWSAFKRQERVREHVEADIRSVRSHAMHTERETRDSSARRLSNKDMRTAIVRERKLERQIADQTIERPVAEWEMAPRFNPSEGGARDILSIDGVRKRFGDQIVLDGVGMSLRHGERVVLTGPNGGGKSTLLKVITGETRADDGTVRLGAGVSVGYFGQEQEGLEPDATPLRMIRAVKPMSETEARARLHQFLFSGDEVNRPISRLSYGERARLVLARLVLSGANLLLLDEPTNHLDIASRERFEAALASFSGTILAVLHDRYLIARLATRVIELRSGLLREVWIETTNMA